MEASRSYQMETQKRISRKIFIRWTTRVILGSALWIWYRITSFQTEREMSMEFSHGQDIPMGISYFGKYYLFRTGDSIRAFSTTCTHAGCRIGRGSGDTLQCSCHCSQCEGMSGKPLKGPAIKPLRELECRFNGKTGQWIVKFNSGIV